MCDLYVIIIVLNVYLFLNIQMYWNVFYITIVNFKFDCYLILNYLSQYYTIHFFLFHFGLEVENRINSEFFALCVMLCCCYGHIIPSFFCICGNLLVYHLLMVMDSKQLKIARSGASSQGTRCMPGTPTYLGTSTPYCSRGSTSFPMCGDDVHHNQAQLCYDDIFRITYP